MLTAAVTEVVDHPCIKHRWGSSTAGYTKVGSDYLQAALARALAPAWDFPDGQTRREDR